MRSLLSQGGTFSGDRVFYVTPETRGLLYDFAAGGRSMKSLVVKHSVNVDGHKTSISLEGVFWTALKEIAHERRETVQRLITSINADRQSANLSSALRIFVLRHYMDQSSRQSELFQQREIPVQ